MEAKPVVIVRVNTRRDKWSVRSIPPHTTQFLVHAGMAVAFLEAKCDQLPRGYRRSFYATVHQGLHSLIQQQIQERERQVGIIAL